MRGFTFIIFLLSVFNSLSAQVGDMHAHLTNKHFMKDKVMPEEVIEAIEQTGKLPRKYLRNWEPRLNPKRMKKGDSNFGNYFQTTYSGLEKGDYRIAVQSISPWEMNLFHDRGYYFRNIMRLLGPVASHIPIRRYKRILRTAPFTEAYSEFLYTIHQQMLSPTGKFKIYFPANHDSLRAHINDENTCIGLISYEGGHILFGKKVVEKKGFLKPALSEIEKEEVRTNIQLLKTSSHKTFFITPVHFLWNTFAGQAKALDKIELRKLLSLLFRWKSVGTKLVSKFGTGLPPIVPAGNKEKKITDTATCNCPSGMVRVDNACFNTSPGFDGFGKEVFIRLLDPSKSNPIYIDVKHLDVRARIDYYILHDSLQKAWRMKIPIIYSHGAVSGEKLKVAYHTSVTPLLDKYAEVKDPRAFYTDLISGSNNYNCALINDYPTLYQNNKLVTTRITADDFKLSSTLEDSCTAGWFYPWSINLFDEEIEKIYDSDGLIGVMMDERTLGWNLPMYQQNDNYKKWLRDTLISMNYLQKTDSEERLDSFRIAETFMRNLFYIVKQSGRKDSTAWDHISLGSDFDGFINPIDICKTADHVPAFKKYLINAIPVFLAIHKEYQINEKSKNLLFGLSPDRAIEKMFIENTRTFILKYFDKTVRY